MTKSTCPEKFAYFKVFASENWDENKVFVRDDSIQFRGKRKEIKSVQSQLDAQLKDIVTFTVTATSSLNVRSLGVLA